ncbi:MAG: ABC transporter permease [Acidobacteriota bacterium]
MRFLWNSTLKDLRRRLRDPLALLVWLGVPVLITALIMTAFGGSSGPAPKASLLVADLDRSVLSQLLVGALGQTPVIQTESVEEEPGRKRMDEGEASALLVIPEGFGAAVLAEEPTTLRLITNPAQRILPEIVEQTLSIVVDATFYLQRLLGREIQQFSGGPPKGAATFPDDTITSFSLVINRLVKRMSRYVFPPVIEVQTQREETQSASSANVGALFFPGILFMALLFTAQGLSTDVWDELTRGTLRRALTLPPGIHLFLAGKLLASSIVIAAICLVYLVTGIWLFDVDPWVLPLGLVWSAFSGTLFLCVMTLLQLYASSQRTANILTTMIVFPLVMIGGSFFPLETMPVWLARIGRWTPNGWAGEQLKAILANSTDVASLSIAFLGLGAIAATAFWISAHRLKRGFLGV